MRADLLVIGLQTTMKRYIAASATRYEVGEPLHSLAALTSGVANVNTYVLAAADTPVVGTHKFGGVAQKQCKPIDTGTVAAHVTEAACPVPYVGIIRGKAEIATNVDTISELTGVIQDVVLIDYNSTGGADGGELYTIKDVASADTSALEIVDGNMAKGTLDVTIDARGYRHDVV